MAGATSSSALIGKLDHHVAVPSRFVESRNVDVWLPPGYDPPRGRRYAAIYAHDGQNLFEPGNAFGGVDWGVGATLSSLICQGDARQAIVIGIWNTEERWRERLHLPLRFLLQPSTKPEPR